MKENWDDKAEKNPYHWVDSSKKLWNKEDYYKKGSKEVLNYAISFLRNKGFNESDIKKMRALDVGCGTGRLTTALANHFGFVDGIDISEKMIKIAKRDNKDVANLEFYINNGLDLERFSDNTYDFIFSFLVFQHIPKRSIIINYLKEIYRVLKSGMFMKIQVRGYPGYLPLRLVEWRYQGFDSFFVALSEIRRSRLPKIFFPKIKKYSTVFGAFFKIKELAKILEKIGYTNVKLFHEPTNMKYLWISGKK